MFACLLVGSFYSFGGVVEWQTWFASICLSNPVDEPSDIAIYVSNGKASSKNMDISQSNLMESVYVLLLLLLLWLIYTL